MCCTKPPRTPTRAGAGAGAGTGTGAAWAGPEGARARRGLGPDRDDDRERPGPGRALGGESVPGPPTPEPATPTSLAPARAPEKPSRLVRGTPGGPQPRGPRGGGAPLAGGMEERVSGRAASQARSYGWGGGGRRPKDRWGRGWARPGPCGVPGPGGPGTRPVRDLDFFG